MKKAKKILCAVLCFVLAFAFTACKKDNLGNNADKPAEDYAFTKGVHVYNAPDTDKFILENGVSDYTVVIPDAANSTLVTAKNEFVYLFQKATGVKLSELRDSGLNFSDDAKYISIGETALLTQAGISVDKLYLGQDGGRIVTKGNSVFIFGGADSGSLFAVYTFMNIVFGMETYYKDCMEIQTGVTEVKLKDFDVTDIPDFAFRARNQGILGDSSADYDENNFSDRMKMDLGRGTNMMPIHAEFDNPSSKSAKSTNADCYLPRETYGDTHTKWFSDAGDQFCYTAHGDAAELELMIDECAKKIYNSLKIYTPDKCPNYNIITLTQQDNNDVCTCAACTEARETYGTNAAALIRFNNAVAAKVENWMAQPENEPYKRDDWTLLFFAYEFSQYAPASYNEETKKYEPNDPSLVLGDHVGIYFAQFYDNQKSILDPINDAPRNNIDAWGCLTDKIYCWTYSTSFRCYMLMYDSFNFYTSEGYQYLANKSTRFLFNQAQHDTGGTSTGWNNLKLYLDSKLMWDTTLDAQELTDNWFDAMFRESAPIMKQLFYDMRAYNAKLVSENNGYKINSAIANRFNIKQYWSLATAEQWLALCDEAKLAVEHYKITNPTLYRQICNHIEAEALSPLYIILNFFGTEINSAEKARLVQRVREDIQSMGLEKMLIQEHNGTLEEWISGIM